MKERGRGELKEERERERKRARMDTERGIKRAVDATNPSV